MRDNYIATVVLTRCLSPDAPSLGDDQWQCRFTYQGSEPEAMHYLAGEVATFFDRAATDGLDQLIARYEAGSA